MTMVSLDEVTKGLAPAEIRDCVNQTTLNFFGGKVAMTKYTDKQSILDEALGEYAQYGFSLAKTDDHLLELWFKDNRIAVYNRPKATPEIIQEGCKNYLASILRSL